MQAVVLRELNGPEGLRMETVEDPSPAAGEVCVRLHAAALNHRDLWITRGQYAGIKLPVILGSDGAGIVESIGSGVDKALEGTKVLINPGLDWGPDPAAQQKSFHILGLPRNGTFAELVTIPAAYVFPLPDGLSFEESAAIPLGGVTAYRGLVTRGRLKAGETVLVTGIGGGVSALALQIALKLGAKVLVTSGSQAKLQRAREMGAAGGVNYHTADWAKEIVKLNDGKGVDLVLDSAGGSPFLQAIDAVRPGGRVVNYGATAGPVPQLVLAKVFWRQIDILGTTMGTSDDFAAMLKLFGRDKIRPVIDREYPLAEASAALKHMEEAGQFGKIILRPQ